MTDFVERSPAEDAGAETQGRYRFQAEVAARRCVKILRGDGIRSIICEWHTDFIIQYEDGSLELVSVKHLESSQPRWTVTALADDGGLKTLCRRWREADCNPRCTLETNGGLRTGKDEPGGLRDALASEDPDAIRSWAARLAPLLEVDAADTEAFLQCLKIDDRMPGRNEIRAVNLLEHLGPFAQELAIAPGELETAYERIVAVVERASRDDGSGESVVALLATPDRLRADVQVRETLARRTIDRERLRLALRPPAPLIPLTLAAGTGHETVLVKKLRRGGVGPTGIQNARNLRSSWLKLRATWATGLPGDDDAFEDLAARIVMAAEQAERKAMEDGTPWGDRMNGLLQAGLTPTTVGGHPYAVDEARLLGFAYELAEQCRIWFSDEFDTGA